MLTKSDTPEKLPQFITPASSETSKASMKRFSVEETDSLNKKIDWPVRNKSHLLLRKREPSSDPRTGSTSEPNISDENNQQVSSAQPLGYIASC